MVTLVILHPPLMEFTQQETKESYESLIAFTERSKKMALLSLRVEARKLVDGEPFNLTLMKDYIIRVEEMEIQRIELLHQSEQYTAD